MKLAALLMFAASGLLILIAAGMVFGPAGPILLVGMTVAFIAGYSLGSAPIEDGD